VDARIAATDSDEWVSITCTMTDAPWLNAGVIKRATLTGSDDCDHVPRRRRIHR
jgi:hypothetical protein